MKVRCEYKKEPGCEKKKKISYMESINLGKDFDVNKKQRIVLIIGAGALLYSLFTSPKISIVKGTYVTPPPDKKNVAKMIDIRTAITRAVAILGGTLLIAVALKDRKGNRTHSVMERELISNENGKTDDHKKYILAKVIHFLKNFF
jgi:hypothetical protein